MTQAGAVVDVVRVEQLAGELLEEIVLLVAALRRGQQAERLAAVPLAHGHQLPRDHVEGGVPVDLDELRALATEQRTPHARPREPGPIVDVDPAEAALDAEQA